MKLAEVKGNLNKPVRYKDGIYTLAACILRKNKDFYYQAELQSLNSRSVLICDLGSVEVIE